MCACMSPSSLGAHSLALPSHAWRRAQHALCSDMQQYMGAALEPSAHSRLIRHLRPGTVRHAISGRISPGGSFAALHHAGERSGPRRSGAHPTRAVTPAYIVQRCVCGRERESAGCTRIVGWGGQQRSFNAVRAVREAKHGSCARMAVATRDVSRLPGLILCSSSLLSTLPYQMIDRLACPVLSAALAASLLLSSPVSSPLSCSLLSPLASALLFLRRSASSRPSTRRPLGEVILSGDGRRSRSQRRNVPRIGCARLTTIHALSELVPRTHVHPHSVKYTRKKNAQPAGQKKSRMGMPCPNGCPGGGVGRKYARVAAGTLFLRVASRSHSLVRNLAAGFLANAGAFCACAHAHRSFESRFRHDIPTEPRSGVPAAGGRHLSTIARLKALTTNRSQQCGEPILDSFTRLRTRLARLRLLASSFGGCGTDVEGESVGGGRSRQYLGGRRRNL